MRFRIDLKIFLLILLFYLTMQLQEYMIMFIFILIHELGHILAGIILGLKPEVLEFIPQGLRIEFKINEKDYNKKILNGNILELKKIVIAAAGPITNILIIILILNINKLNNNTQISIFEQINIVYTNLLIILFNILPIYPLDGGKILKGMIHIFKGKRKAEKYINNISFVTMILITILSSLLILYLQNIAILIVNIFLWVLFISEDIKYKKRDKIYKLIDKTIEKREI